MTDTTHAPRPLEQLAEIRRRLGELVTIRLNDGFTEEEGKEYHRLVELETNFL